MSKQQSTAILSLGSNLGNRLNSLLTAIRLLNNSAVVCRSFSSIYETQPWGFESNSLFLNMVIRVQSGLIAPELLDTALRIEKSMGRMRNSPGYSSRIIDIDLLFFGNQIINRPELTIPHPLLLQRRFVLEPLCELDPAFIHPVAKKPLRDLLKICPDTSEIKKWKPREEIGHLML